MFARIGLEFVLRHLWGAVTGLYWTGLLAALVFRLWTCKAVSKLQEAVFISCFNAEIKPPSNRLHTSPHYSSDPFKKSHHELSFIIVSHSLAYIAGADPGGWIGWLAIVQCP